LKGAHGKRKITNFEHADSKIMFVACAKNEAIQRLCVIDNNNTNTTAIAKTLPSTTTSASAFFRKCKFGES
jgi:hypothetical protein